MVIDEQIVVAGSFNYTQPANDYNDENLFVLGSVFPKVEDISRHGRVPGAREAHEGRDRTDHRRLEVLRAIVPPTRRRSPERRAANQATKPTRIPGPIQRDVMRRHAWRS